MSFIDDDSYLSQDISEADPAVARLLRLEAERQSETLEMIASENFTSQAVLQAVGSVLTNKYAEGLPGKRYYGGCEVVDEVEQLAIDRALELFGAEHVNVQPHSGATANEAAYYAVLSPGDRVLGMSLSHGGHLSHGLKVNFSGRLYEFHHYGVRRSDCRIDMDQVRDMARELRPALIVAGASAYPRVIDFPAFREIADEVGARLMVDMAHIAGLVAAGVHPTPVGIADIVTTTIHKTLGGPRGGMVMATAELGPAIDKAVFPGLQGGPLMHVIAAKAVALLEALQPEFKEYQQQVLANARAMAARLIKRGFSIVSKGTDNHLFLLSLIGRDITGKEADAALGNANITVNKNAVPNDPRPPMITSGLRLGTPASTTRGFKEREIEQVADIIADVLEANGAAAAVEKARPQVLELCRRFPVYGA